MDTEKKKNSQAVNRAERKRSSPSVNATLPLSNVQARPPAGAVRPMISRRQGDSGVLPGAAQEPPLPSAGWGYLKSDTAALPLEVAPRLGRHGRLLASLY